MQTLNETSRLISYGIRGIDDNWVRTQFESDGWTTQPSKTGWYSRVRGDQLEHIGVRDLARHDPLIGDQFDDAEAEYSIESWRKLTGVWYRHTPGLTATMHLLPHVVGKARLRCYNSNNASWWQPPAPITDLNWTRPRPPGRPAKDQMEHRWDMRSAYLAAAASAPLPARQLAQTGNDPAEGATGYYRIQLNWPATIPNHFAAMLGRPDRQGCRWVCQPVYEWCRQLGPITVHDSWTETGGRLLRPWAEQWRDLIATPDLWQVFRTVLKRGYAEAIGLMNVPRGTLYRPDWRHIIIDQARASLLRRIYKVWRNHDLLPTKIEVDSIWYPAGSILALDLADDLGVGARIGNMRYEGVEQWT